MRPIYVLFIYLDWGRFQRAKQSTLADSSKFSEYKWGAHEDNFFPPKLANRILLVIYLEWQPSPIIYLINMAQEADIFPGS